MRSSLNPFLIVVCLSHISSASPCSRESILNADIANTISLDCSSDNLESLPSEINRLTRLKTLKLDNNELQSLPKSFGDLSSLTWLSVHSNQLQSIPKSFGELSNLRWLSFFNNQLQSLPESFWDLSSLRHLNFNKNQFRTLPASSFADLSSLTDLYLNENQLLWLPESIGDLSSLTELYLDENQLMFLPESFGDLSSLTKLNLHSNRLRSLPESFGDLSSLTWLSFFSNQLQSLPESFWDLSSLIWLSFSQNQLESLPQSIERLSSLTHLNVDSNQLELLPESITSLSRLNTLYASYNQLKWLPESFGDLASLTSLNLQQNKIWGDVTSHFNNLPLSLMLVTPNYLHGVIGGTEYVTVGDSCDAGICSSENCIAGICCMQGARTAAECLVGPISSTCKNDPVGWVDSYGDGCNWYAIKNRCSGEQYENMGKDAKQACCVCGGGIDVCSYHQFYHYGTHECKDCPSREAISTCEGLAEKQCRKYIKSGLCTPCGKKKAYKGCFPGNSDEICKADEPELFYEMCYNSPTGCDYDQFMGASGSCRQCPTRTRIDACSALTAKTCGKLGKSLGCMPCGKGKQFTGCFPNDDDIVCEQPHMYEMCYSTPTEAPVPAPTTAPSASPTAAPTLCNSKECICADVDASVMVHISNPSSLCGICGMNRRDWHIAGEEGDDRRRLLETHKQRLASVPRYTAQARILDAASTDNDLIGGLFCECCDL